MDLFLLSQNFSSSQSGGQGHEILHILRMSPAALGEELPSYLQNLSYRHQPPLHSQTAKWTFNRGMQCLCPLLGDTCSSFLSLGLGRKAAHPQCISNSQVQLPSTPLCPQSSSYINWSWSEEECVKVRLTVVFLSKAWGNMSHAYLLDALCGRLGLSTH